MSDNSCYQRDSQSISLFRRFTAELLCCRSEEALDNNGESVNGTGSMSRVSSSKCQVERS